MAEKPKTPGKRTKKKTKSGGGGVRVRNGGAGGGADVRNRKASCCVHCFASWHEDDVDGRSCDRSCSAHGRPSGNQTDTNAASFLRRGPAITSFYCKCAQLYGELHQATVQSASALFTEEYVAELGLKLLVSVEELFTQSIGEANGASCPFVMMLSILLPSLRKFWTWTQKTSALWFAVDSSTGNSMLWSMIAMHDILLRLTMECERISHLIEVNEKLELEQSSALLMTRMSTSSLAPAAPTRPIPQVKRISLEFAELFEELKVQLADLSEAIFESVEQTANRLSRSIVPKESSSKTRGSVTEFVDQLLVQLLDPLGVRALALQSPSRVYLLPTLLEKCISVTIEEFVLDNAKMNEIHAARFEKAIARLLEWSSELEGNYNAALLDDFQSQVPSAGAPVTLQRSLLLTSIDGFKRLEAITNAWLRNSKDYEGAGAFGRVKANLGGLRTTIARTISAKNGRSSN